MGFLPSLNNIAISREMTDAFGGYNNNLRISDNEFRDMKNMTSSYYPVISPRNKRGIFTMLSDPNGLTSKNNLFWVDGTTLYYNGIPVTGLMLQNSPKQFVSMGSYLLIFPDKVYFNTADSTHGNLGASITLSVDVKCTLTKIDGTAYPEPTVSATEPEPPADGELSDGALWLNTSEPIHILQEYSAATASWVTIPTTYIKIAAENIGKLFSKNDGVTVSGFTGATDLNSDYVLVAASDNYIVVKGIIDETVNEPGITVERKIPDMDFVTELDNRVWGCSSQNHEIYASKLGDPKNWNCFMGASTDSYAATVGSDGDFTGACTHLGYVCFFKEDMLHQVAGNKPSNFSINSTACRGVAKGSDKSLAIVNEILYYKSRNEICAFDGSLPQAISYKLGNTYYKNAVGGALGNKYYVSMEDAYGVSHMFVYDTQTKLWHKEDNVKVSYFAAHEGELFYLDADTRKIMTVNGRLSVHQGGTTYDTQRASKEEDFDWFIESGEIGMSLPNNKFVSQILIRMEADTGAPIKIAFEYDSSGEWVTRVTVSATASEMRTFRVPLIPRRCDHLRIKITGRGNAKIYSISKAIESGGDY